MSKPINENMRADYGSASVQMKTQPLNVEFDAMALGKGPAEAIAIEFQKDVAAAGWINTGRLANGIRVEAKESHYEIVPPTGRLNNQGLLERFQQQIRAMTDDVTARPKVRAALLESLKLMFGGRRNGNR